MIFTVMFAIIVALPIISAALFIAYITAYTRLMKKNNISPGIAGEEKLSKYKFFARVFGIVALVTLIILGAVTALLFLFVNNM